jgi:uncharacterized RDD family membrane protein YckC
MSSTPPAAPGPDQQAGPPIPPGYKAGDYIPFTARDPDNPTSVAGQWADPARQAQMTGQQGGQQLTPQQQYRAIYGHDAPDRVEYASWGRRVLGYVVDSFLSAVASIPLIIGWVMLSQDNPLVGTDANGNPIIDDGFHAGGATIVLLVLGGLITLAFSLYNTIIRQGRTGYSFGKTAVGIRLVKESTGQPMGAGLCFVRQLAHYIDSLLCYLGWLWPLWDSKNQTIADKIMATVVVIQPADSAQ